MLIKNVRNTSFAVIIAILIGLYTSLQVNPILKIIPFILLLIGIFVIVRSRLIPLLVSLLLIGVFFFSVVLGMQVSIFLTIDRISIIALILCVFFVKANYKTSTFENLFLLFIFTIMISTLVIQITGNSYGLLFQSFKKIILMIVEFFLLFYVLSRFLVKENINKVLNHIFIFGFLVSVYGILEYYTQKNYLFDFVIQHGLPYNAEYETTFLWGQIRGGVMRAKSTFSHTLEFAGFLSLLIPYVLFKISNVTRTFKKWVYIIILASILVAMVFTISRSIIAISIMIIVLYIIMTKKINIIKKSAIVYLGLLTSIILVYSLFSYFFPEGTSQDTSILIRLGNLLTGLELIKENFLFGIGYGYIPPGQVYDNFIFSLLIQSGIVGVLLFLITFIYILISFFIMYKKVQNKEESDFYLAVFLIILTFLLLNFAFDAMGFITVGKLFLILLAIGVAKSEKYKNKIS